MAGARVVLKAFFTGFANHQPLTTAVVSDRYHFHLGIDALDQSFDASQRARNRAWASPAGALVVDFERAAFQADDIEVAAVSLQERPHFFIEQLVDLLELELVAVGHRSAAALILRKPGRGLGEFFRCLPCGRRLSN